MNISRTLSRVFAALLFAAASLSLANAATLLPPGEQTFFDLNGQPIVGGTIAFYIPGTLTPKDTYKDAGQTILNSNPVITDGSGRAIIYGSGAYRQIVKDFLGNILWDQLTADTASAGSISSGGISGGTPNAQTVSSGSFSSQSGQAIQLFAGFTNTSSMTLVPSGAAAIAVLKDTLSGPVALTGGEIVKGNAYIVVYDATLGAFHLVTPPYASGFGPQTTLASASTVNIGAVAGNNVVISGSTTINSLGSGNLSDPVYFVSFTGSPLLVNSATLQLPGGANLQASPGSNLLAMAVSSGFQVVSFNVAGVVSAGVVPQGRLTLATSTPVMTSNVTAATAIIYTPYLGSQVPVWNGTGFSAVSFTETSQLLSDTTLSPAAAVAASCYDEFEWSSAGTIVVTRGPAWTNCTTRGYTLNRVGGLLVNAAAITNGPAAGFGVFVGTIATDASGATCSWSLGGSGTGGVAGVLDVWNMYGRVLVAASSQDTQSYNYASNVIRQANASTGNQITFVSGQAEDGLFASYSTNVSPAASQTVNKGIGLDTITTSNFSVNIVTSPAAGGTPWSLTPSNTHAPMLGQHYFSAVENTTASAGMNVSNVNQLNLQFRM